MTPGPVDDYLNRLERELRQRGVENGRIVEEAREHLLDAVEDGRHRGLSIDDAAREAVERFGAPGTIVAHAISERDRTMNRFAAALDTVWHRRWWILAPTVLTAVITGVASYNFLPMRYRSESMMRITAVPSDNGRSTDASRARARLQQINDSILSRTSLERIISDFGLYQAGQERVPLDSLVQEMRRNISVYLTSDQLEDEHVAGFNVSFQSPNPTLAMQITSRLAGMIIDENMRQGDMQPGGTTALIKAEDVSMAARIERRRTGEQFRIINPARLPDEPVGPSRLMVNIAGAFVGLGLGLVFIGVRGRSKTHSG